MSQVILDTDILSEILRGQNQTVIMHANSYVLAHDCLCFTSFSVFEILSGLRKRDARNQLTKAEALFALNSEIVPTAADYRLAADIVGDLQRNGNPIGIVDPMIAACGLRCDFPIATGNIDHYSYIQQAGYKLKLENWRSPVL